MTRRTRLSAAFLSVLLVLAAISAVGVPVNTAENDVVEGSDPCRYTATGGEASGTLRDASLTGLGLPTGVLSQRVVREQDRAITTDGVSVAFETVRATVENVTVRNDSALSASIGYSRLHLRDVIVTGPGLPNARIADETFVIRNPGFSLNGMASGRSKPTDTIGKLHLSLDNVTLRNTGKECLTNSDSS